MTISQSDLGRALGLSKQAISKLKGQGMPVDSVASAQAWREARQNVAARKPTPSVPPLAAPRAPVPPNAFDRQPDDFSGLGVLGEDRDEARTRREIAEANLAEMSEGKMRRELILVKAVQAQLSTDYATTREAMMQIPARLSPLLAAESNPASVHALLTNEIHLALSTLAGAGDRVPMIEGAFD